MDEKPWEGRFSEKTERIVEIFTSSIDTDKRLYRYDIEGSVAHCKMLAKTSIISENDAALLIEGLGKIKSEIEQGGCKRPVARSDKRMGCCDSGGTRMSFNAWTKHQSPMLPIASGSRWPFRSRH